MPVGTWLICINAFSLAIWCDIKGVQEAAVYLIVFSWFFKSSSLSQRKTILPFTNSKTGESIFHPKGWKCLKACRRTSCLYKFKAATQFPWLGQYWLPIQNQHKIEYLSWNWHMTHVWGRGFLLDLRWGAIKSSWFWAPKWRCFSSPEKFPSLPFPRCHTYSNPFPILPCCKTPRSSAEAAQSWWS